MNKNILEKKISIGHNGKQEFIKLIEKYHNYIYEVYFGPAHWVIPSPRPCPGKLAELSEINYTKIIKNHITIVKSMNWNIHFSLLLNAQCWDGKFRSKSLIQSILDFMDLLDFKFDDVVVSDPFLAKKLKPIIPEKTFSTSIISNLDTVDMCLSLLDYFSGFDTICIGHRLNYKLKDIEHIKKLTGKKIKLLLNQGCYFHCPDYVLHSTALAHAMRCEPTINDGNTLYCNTISSILNEHSWKNLTHQAINPKYLSYYNNIVDVFKLSSRMMLDINSVDLIMDGYIHGNSNIFAKKLFMGGSRAVSYEVAAIFSLVEYPEDYIAVRSNCGNKCYDCEYCKNLWKKAHEKYFSLSAEERPTEEELYFHIFKM